MYGKGDCQQNKLKQVPLSVISDVCFLHRNRTQFNWKTCIPVVPISITNLNLNFNNKTKIL